MSIASASSVQTKPLNKPLMMVPILSNWHLFVPAKLFSISRSPRRLAAICVGGWRRWSGHLCVFIWQRERERDGVVDVYTPMAGHPRKVLVRDCPRQCHISQERHHSAAHTQTWVGRTIRELIRAGREWLIRWINNELHVMFVWMPGWVHCYFGILAGSRISKPSSDKSY